MVENNQCRKGSSQRGRCGEDTPESEGIFRPKQVCKVEENGEGMKLFCVCAYFKESQHFCCQSLFFVRYHYTEKSGVFLVSFRPNRKL